MSDIVGLLGQLVGGLLGTVTGLVGDLTGLSSTSTAPKTAMSLSQINSLMYNTVDQAASNAAQATPAIAGAVPALVTQATGQGTVNLLGTIGGAEGSLSQTLGLSASSVVQAYQTGGTPAALQAISGISAATPTAQLATSLTDAGNSLGGDVAKMAMMVPEAIVKMTGNPIASPLGLASALAYL